MMRARPASLALALAAVGALAALADAAAGPEIGVRIGPAFGVDSPKLVWTGVRDPGTVEYQPERPGGGVAFATTALWAWEDRFRFGVEACFISGGTWNFDEGAWHVAQDDWLRHHGWEGLTLAPRTTEFGALELGQLDGWGAAWRVDALGPWLRRIGRSYASLTYGYYLWHSERKLDPADAAPTVPAAVQDSLRWEVEAQGNPGARQSAVGGTLALGIERAVTAHHTLGLTVSGTALSGKFVRRYFAAGLEWRWRP